MNKFEELLLLEKHMVSDDEYEKFAKKFEYETEEDEATFLGVINLDITTDDLFTEDSIGELNLGKHAGTVTVSVRLREGWEKPHMHLEGLDFHCAIRLDIAENFVHAQYSDTLSSKQAKIFNTFMKNKPKKLHSTRWEIAADIFNMRFPDHPLTINKQPDYSKLKK